MKNDLIIFKNDLKAIQSIRKQFIKQLESELEVIKQILNHDPSIKKADKITIINKFKLSPMLYSLNEIIEESIDKRKKKNTDVELERFHEYLEECIKRLKGEYLKLQNIINAFENDKIKDPINDIQELINNMKFTTLTLKEINQIIGMAISFNSQYAKKNKNHNIQDINIIHQLAEYYNLDGTFKYNEDVIRYQELLEMILSTDDIDFEIYNIINNTFNKINEFTIDELVELLIESNRQLRKKKQEKEKTVIEPSNKTEKEDRQALQELRKYYKNGKIIAIPENLEEFYKLLDQTSLDETEKKYIKNLINQEIAKIKSKKIDKYLSKEEIMLYQRAKELLNSFTSYSEDSFILKEYIEELQTILNMLEEESDEENKQYLLQEKEEVIEKLAEICNKYNEIIETPNNKLIFLLDKDFTPYIYQDINSLDQTYKKTILSLINKISPDNQTQFRKILSNESLPYTMHEVSSSKAHIAFVEIKPGIYIIIGAKVARNGYKELNNRLKINIDTIKKIAEMLKNEKVKEQLLKKNEELLENLHEDQKQNLTKKKKKNK